MKPTAKIWTALALALVLWAVETWLLVDGSERWLSPQVAVVVSATTALMFAPLVFEEATGWFRATCWIGCALIAGFVFVSVLERSAKPVDTQIAGASARVDAERRINTNLDAAKARVAAAEREVQTENKKGGCGPRCQVWQQHAAAHQAHVDALTAELNDLAPVVAYPVAKRLASMMPFSEATIVNWLPMIQPIGFQLMIWCLISFWARGRSETVSDTVSKVSGGGGRGLGLVSENREIVAVKRALHSSGRALTNDELAASMGVAKSEASKRVAMAVAAGAVSKVRTGKHVAVSLSYAH